MKKLNSQESSNIIAGDRLARIKKQLRKCQNGSMRACRRAGRMLIRWTM